MAKIELDKDSCMLCGGCAAVCPVGAIDVLETYVDIDHDSCTSCGSCVKVCPVGALTLE